MSFSEPEGKILETTQNQAFFLLCRHQNIAKVFSQTGIGHISDVPDDYSFLSFFLPICDIWNSKPRIYENISIGCLASVRFEAIQKVEDLGPCRMNNLSTPVNM